MEKQRRKKRWGRRKVRWAVMGVCMVFVCISFVVSSLWSGTRRLSKEKERKAQVSERTFGPAEKKRPETEKTAEPTTEPTRKPVDKTLQIYTYLQGPKSWNQGIDWSGEWGESYMDGGSFGGFGCGLCCMANIYSSLTPYQCSPVDMYRYAKKHTGYGGGMAIDWGYIRRGLTSLGLHCHVERKQETYHEFRENIRKSKCAIVLVSSANSTVHWKNTPGHYVTIFEFQEKTDKVFLADSGDPDHNRRWIHLKKVYRSLKTASNWQYLVVSGYDKQKDHWHHKKANGTWNRPSYLKAKS
ncbi:MAG: hypothetical protein KH026_10655 [Clostridium sp.]|nr:hypothetical protein [Clostridium sp.]